MKVWIGASPWWPAVILNPTAFERRLVIDVPFKATMRSIQTGASLEGEHLLASEGTDTSRFEITGKHFLGRLTDHYRFEYRTESPIVDGSGFVQVLAGQVELSYEANTDPDEWSVSVRAWVGEITQVPQMATSTVMVGYDPYFTIPIIGEPRFEREEVL